MINLSFTFILCFVTLFSFSQNLDSARFYYQAGVEKSNEKLFAVASKNFEKAISFDPNYTEAYIANGKIELQMSKIWQATENFTKAYQLDPKNSEVINALSSLYFNNRQFQKAIDLAQQCNNCDNSNRILGMSNYNLEDYAKAEKYLNQAITKNDKDAEVYYTLGLTELELENEKSAIIQYL
ncbi:MAG: tetratricopeptide repeat protein, partial [Ginsengibacter sp.]